MTFPHTSSLTWSSASASEAGSAAASEAGSAAAAEAGPAAAAPAEAREVVGGRRLVVGRRGLAVGRPADGAALGGAVRVGGAENFMGLVTLRSWRDLSIMAKKCKISILLV